MNKEKIVFVVGPTAVGKTVFAVKLAKRIRGEIISADSMQVYRGTRLLSQVPTEAERQGIRHHLMGNTPPEKEYNAAIFVKKAAKTIRAVLRRKNTPIIVGGSGLYIKALIDGLFPSPKADLKFRRRMEGFARRYGSKRLHKRLAKLDPASAASIHSNDTRRIIRALEVRSLTGRTMSELKSQTKGLKDDYRIMLFGLTMPRQEIYARIEARIERMFRSRVIEEVRRLRKRVLSKTSKAVLGYGELIGYLDGRYDLEKAKELLKRNTRRFAKRQFTWFRADKRIKWFDLDEVGEEGVLAYIQNIVSGVNLLTD
jgi:tRNA dimethylallyltransferase